MQGSGLVNILDVEVSRATMQGSGAAASLLDSALAQLQSRLECMVQQSHQHAISDSCRFEVRGLDQPLTWRRVLDHRLAATWSKQPVDLIWLDDKVEQVDRAQEHAGLTEPLHLPVLAHAREHDEKEWETLKAVVDACVLENNPIVVKPRHAHDSLAVFMATEPAEVGSQRILSAAAKAMRLFDDSWQRECWQLSQVKLTLTY